MRGEVYDATLEPVVGSEQAGTCPVIGVSRGAINRVSPVIVVVPCTSWYTGGRAYPTDVVIRAPEVGLRVDSVALAGQVRAVDRQRLLRRRGVVSDDSMAQLERALGIALALPGYP